MDKNELNVLLRQHLDSTLNEEQRTELIDFIGEPKNKELVIESLAEIGLGFQESQDYDANRFDPLLQNILRVEKIAVRIQHKKARVVRLFRKIAVAASILLVFGAGYWLLERNKTSKTEPKTVLAKQDVNAPERN